MCSSCKGKCKERIDPPQQPLLICCPKCEGEDSPDCTCCGGTGKYEVTGCPCAEPIAAGVFDILRARHFAEKGIPPVAGGMLDQTQSFLDAVRIVERTINKTREWEQSNPFE